MILNNITEGEARTDLHGNTKVSKVDPLQRWIE